MHRALVILFCLIAALPAHAGRLAVQVFDDKQEPLPDAVVYLMAGQTNAPPAAEGYEVEQRGKMFHPFVTVLPVGTQVRFPNRDGIGHQVYSFSPAKNFQLPLSEQETTGTVTFDQPGLVTLGCNIHDWMAAYIYVVATPYYARSDAAGVAVIENLPAGDYEIHVAHPGMKSATALTRRLTATADTEASNQFVLELKPEYFWRPEPREEGIY